MKITKKILSVLTAATVILSFAGVASAADYAYEATDGVSAVLADSAVVDENNVLWMWGYNTSHIMDIAGGADSEDEYGRPYQPTPKKVMENVKAVSTNGEVIAVIKLDNSLWMWGKAYSGIIGNGNVIDLVDEEDQSYVLTPTKIMDDVVQVSVGGKHAVALKSDGSLWGWGNNYFGQLGNDKKYNATLYGEPCQTVPIKIMDGVRQICTYSGWGRLGGQAGGTAVIKEDSSLWMWGSNAMGQLGSLDIYDGIDFGGYKYQSTPVKVMDSVAAVAGGRTYLAAIKQDGTLWTWGYDGHGSLGNGSQGDELNDIYPPAMVLDNVASVFCTDKSMGAVRTDGTLWTWGSNVYGRLGRGYDSHDIATAGSGSSVPQKVLDNVAYAFGTLAVKTDGSVWSWGIRCGVEGVNNANQGKAAFRSVPVQLPGIVCKVNDESVDNNAVFTDVDSEDWYYEAVSYAYDQKIMVGTGESRFAPDMQLTRGMLAKILHTMEGMPDAGEEPFSDVFAGDWYAPGVAWAAENGIVKGYGNGKFGPKDTLTVEQAVALLYRYAEHKGMDISTEDQGLSGMNKVDRASDWALEALRWASGAGLFNGMNRSLSPNEGATRAQITVLIYNFMYLA